MVEAYEEERLSEMLGNVVLLAIHEGNLGVCYKLGQEGTDEAEKVAVAGHRERALGRPTFSMSTR